MSLERGRGLKSLDSEKDRAHLCKDHYFIEHTKGTFHTEHHRTPDIAICHMLYIYISRDMNISNNICSLPDVHSAGQIIVNYSTNCQKELGQKLIG